MRFAGLGCAGLGQTTAQQSPTVEVSVSDVVAWPHGPDEVNKCWRASVSSWSWSLSRLAGMCVGGFEGLASGQVVSSARDVMV